MIYRIVIKVYIKQTRPKNISHQVVAARRPSHRPDRSRVSLGEDGLAYPLVTLFAPQPDVGVLAAGSEKGPLRVPAAVPHPA